jgi:multicomponent Na+:H+ antiporter subunit D
VLFRSAGLVTEHYALVAIALIVSTLTLLSMAKVWTEAFWKVPPDEQTNAGFEHGAARPSAVRRPILSPVRRWGMLTPIAVLAAVVVILGVAAETVFTLSERAAEQLLDPTDYIEAVLGVRV